MTTVTTVPFAKLTAPEALNARAPTKDGLNELVDSIAAKGLIQPLAVRPADGESGRYEIIDGRRRYLAMQQLVRTKRMSRSDAVAVIVRNEDDAEALETSLIANTVRLPMHAVDQYEVFARLELQGRTVPEIASRFGLAERTVRQRLALGRLAPAVRKAWKAGKLDDKAAQAFCLDPRHEVQEAALARLGRNLSDYAVRRELAGNRVDASRVPAAVLEAYLQKGGTITESLFEEDGRLIDDPALLKAARSDSLAHVKARFDGQGWAWVAVRSELEGEATWSWDHVMPGMDGADIRDLMTDDEREEFDATEQDLEDAEEGSADEQRLLDEMDRLEQTAWLARIPPEARARSGVLIEDGWHRGGNGRLEFAYGLVRPSADGQADIEDAISQPGSDPERSEAVAGQDEEDDDAPQLDTQLSGALMTTLTETLTLAAQDALPADPRLALKLAVAALASSSWNTPVKLDSHGFRQTIPSGEFHRELRALDGLSDVALLERFARQVAASLALVRAGPLRVEDTALVAALPGEVYLAAARQRFLAEDYFKRAPKQAAIDALDEMVEAGVIAGLGDGMADMTKRDLVRLAAAEAPACGWLPPELRHPDFSISGQGKKAAA